MLAWPAAALAEDDDWGDEEEQSERSVVELHGFAESATSGRVIEDPTTSDELTMAEARFRLEARHERDTVSLSFKGDFVADAIADSAVTIDVREALIAFQLFSWLEVKAGRQVLTWGTGDLLFLNDMFPKDWQSFFIGRDDEYLKAPSNSVKLSFFWPSGGGLDLVWTPLQEPDRYLTGERLSFYNPVAGQRVGGALLVDPVSPSRKLRNGEFAARLHRRVGSVELAGYGYFGFFKRPLGFDPNENRPTFPRLGVYGASARSPLLGGLINIEGGFHHSVDDEAGNDPLVPNSQLRGLLGYEHELISKMTLGLQYYVEYTLDHDDLVAASPTPDTEPDELRHVTTMRLTYRLLRDDLILSLFAFFSPSDLDAYIRPAVFYKLTDALKLTAGANIVFGKEDHTFFAQLEKNTNVYARARYTF